MLLEIENLSKIFTIHSLNGKRIKGCNEVSFHLGEGEFLALSGPSGSGKSTILKCIYRTYLPAGGNIWYESKKYGRVDISNISEHILLDIRTEEIGYVSQFLKIVPRVTAIDAATEPLLKNNVPAGKAREKASELLERLNIPSHLFDTYPATFSGGEQQRINIARATIWQPRLLLLDEPIASLDKGSAALVVDVLKELKQAGTTMIGVFHDNESTGSIADKIYDTVTL